MSLGLDEGLKIGVIEELAWVEGKLPPFLLLMCPHLIDIQDLSCMDNFLVLGQNMGAQYVFLNGIDVLRCIEGLFFNSKKFSTLRREHENAFSYIKTCFDNEDGFLPVGSLTLINAGR